MIDETFQIHFDCPFGQVSIAAMLDPRLRWTSKVVYGALCCYRNVDTGEAWPKQATLARFLTQPKVRGGLATTEPGNLRTLKHALEELRDTGWIRVEHNHRTKHTRYYISSRSSSLPQGLVELGNVQSPTSGGVGEHTVPELGTAAVAYRSTDQHSTHQKGSARGSRKDPRRAIAFLTRFEAWYLRIYRRPHSSPDRGQIFATDALLRRVDRDLLRVPAVNEATAEAVVGCVLTVALRSKVQIWFLRNGEPLCLDEILSTKKWQVLWDRFLEDGQRQGWPMGEFDGRDEGDRKSAA